jgi:hypothetical protein
MAACRSLAEADEERRPYYTALEETVRPWLSPRVLARTDREILSTLLDRCRAVERELGGRRWTPEWPRDRWPGWMFIAGAVGLVLAWSLPEFSHPAVEAARDVADAAWLTIKYAGGYYKLSALAVLIVAGAVYTIARSVRASP